MTKNLSYPTGMTSGMTNISPASLYRYVRSFPEFFSPTVTRHVHGRRWTDQDILIAMSIQALFDRRTGAEGIRQALQEGWRLDHIQEDHPLTLEALSEVFEACMIYRDEAKKDREEAHHLAVILAQMYKHNRDDHELLVNLQTALRNQAEEINRLSSKKALINFG